MPLELGMILNNLSKNRSQKTNPINVNNVNNRNLTRTPNTNIVFKGMPNMNRSRNLSLGSLTNIHVSQTRSG
tara:strand:+ start:1686 stop:1901 length:216 start_codon:yes stop_codon:yes gene_type:complete